MKDKIITIPRGIVNWVCNYQLPTRNGFEHPLFPIRYSLVFWGQKPRISACYATTGTSVCINMLVSLFIVTTILIQSNGCTPFCTPLHPGIGSGYSSFYGKMLSSLFFHEKRDINSPRSISLSSYYNSLVKHVRTSFHVVLWQYKTGSKQGCR